MSFTAQYRGTCGSCDQEISKGDEIQYAAFDEVVHVNCPEDASGLNRPVCPQCFCEMPVSGVCSCRD